MSEPRDFSVALLANVERTIEARGRFFGIVEAPSAVLDVRIDGRSPLRRGPGGSILLAEPFNLVGLTSALVQTVRVLVSDQAQDISNVVIGGGGGVSITVAESPSTALATGADVAVGAGGTSDIAANASRKRMLVGADVANADPLPLRVRNTAAATAQGAQLQSGQSITLATTAAIRVMNPGAVAQTFWFLEET